MGRHVKGDIDRIVAPRGAWASHGQDDERAASARAAGAVAARGPEGRGSAVRTAGSYACERETTRGRRAPLEVPVSERPLAFLARAVPVVGIAAAAAVIPTVLIVATAGQRVMIAPVVHVVVVGAAGALAAAAAIALSLIAGRLNDSRAVLLGTAFSVMATMLLVHALATPGALVGRNGLMQFAGALNIPVGAAILAASALPALDGRPHRRTRACDPAGLAAVLAVAGAIALIDPGRIPAVPRPGSALAGLVFAVGAGALTLLAWRAGRTLPAHPPHLGPAGDGRLVWLIAAQYGLLHYGMIDLAWWVAHALEVASIGLIGIPAALDLRYGAASRPLVGDLRAADLVADEEAFLGGRVRALMLRLAEKDPSTEGHTRRVAALAVQIGERLGLPRERGCACSRSAACCTTWASWPCPTRSSTSPAS